MRGLWPLLFLPLSCLELPTSTTDDAGAAGNSGLGGGGAASVTGADCVTDSASHVTLCTSLSLCPGLAVDHDLYPDCGFRVAGSSIDLECLCDDYVCPMGAALSCTQAHELLLNSTEAIVCAQVSDGRCAARATTGSTSASACDRACAESCANNPSCLALCGC
jgi:hypothetical protein